VYHVMYAYGNEHYGGRGKPSPRARLASVTATRTLSHYAH